MPTDHTKRSDKQIAHYLNQKMDKIWRIGDRSIECAVKHIGWGAAALAVGKDWTDGLDYQRPWAYGYPENGEFRGAHYIDDWEDFCSLPWNDEISPEERYGDRLTVIGNSAFIDWHDSVYNRLEARLADAWGSIVTVRDQLGEKRFHDCMMLTKYAPFFEDYFKDMLREVSK